MGSLPKYAVTVKRTRREIAVTIDARVQAARPVVFDYIAGEAVLPEVLTGYTPFLPAVVSTSGRTGPWDRPGSWRIVHLKNGGTAREEVTGYERPDAFNYKSGEFTFALRHLATGATGQWWFTADGAATNIRWTYTFKVKGWLGSLLLPLFARYLWSGYMRVCIYNTEKHFLTGGGERPHSPEILVEQGDGKTVGRLAEPPAPRHA